MTSQERHTTAIITLTPDQATKISTIARAQNKSEASIIEQLVRQQLDLLPRQGPGHTRAEITLITQNSRLADIMDPASLWDETVLDRHHQWMTNQDNEPLLTEFTINSNINTPCPYMEATFWQDPEPPHHWRALLNPNTQDIGELGDLPEHLHPHPSLHTAAEALYEAYTERHGTPDPDKALRRTLQNIMDGEQIHAAHYGAVSYQNTIELMHPEIDIQLLCQCFADNLGNTDDTIEDYMTVVTKVATSNHV